MGIIISTITLIILLFMVRVFYLMFNVFTGKCGISSKNRTLKTIFCIGSGGHTSEMIRIISHINLKKYEPRLYILADNDSSSEYKVKEAEKENVFMIHRIPRSRNVKQSYVSSIFTTINATLHTLPLICHFKPEVIFCNGPGTCIPVCLVAFLLRCLFILDCRIVFIESVCRVRTLSLSGKILQFFADVFVIQWPELRHACIRAKYFGRLT
ncbi:unnamed protein product [Danaus chrysippus]|uniref:UDP-N-acetylglucosamine transferase subunit ALG14 n=1 Tax=Danaus chrysippus TaxID=151541 RepID=A0A8J2R4H9_9NEOP|nr:unnamed protein product [Danaus chrysippus]